MIVDRKTFAAALRKVKPAVARRAGIPVLGGVRIDAGTGALALAATDLEVSITTTTEAEGSGSWRVVVPHKLLLEAVKGAGKVEIGPDGSGSFKVGPGRIRLLPSEDFPELPTETGCSASMDAQTFREAAAVVTPAASRDYARPVITGILLESRRNPAGLELTATDSYRLHHVEAWATGLPEGTSAIVPAAALEIVGKLIGARGKGYVGIGFGKGYVRFELDGATLTSRIIEGEYPNWRALEPVEGTEDGEIVGDVETMLAGIAEAAPYARDTSPLRFDLNGKVEIRATSPDLGTYAGELEATWTGSENVSAAYNPHYLAEAVKAGGGRIAVRDGLKPAVCRPVEDSARPAALTHRFALVMPVRLPAPVA